MAEPERTFKRFTVSGGAKWNLTEVVDAHSDFIEVHAERLDMHRDYLDAYAERLAAIEAKLGLEVYAVAPPEDTDGR